MAIWLGDFMDAQFGVVWLFVFIYKVLPHSALELLFKSLNKLSFSFVFLLSKLGHFQPQTLPAVLESAHTAYSDSEDNFSFFHFYFTAGLSTGGEDLRRRLEQVENRKSCKWDVY